MLSRLISCDCSHPSLMRDLLSTRIARFFCSCTWDKVWEAKGSDRLVWNHLVDVVWWWQIHHEPRRTGIGDGCSVHSAGEGQRRQIQCAARETQWASLVLPRSSLISLYLFSLYTFISMSSLAMSCVCDFYSARDMRTNRVQAWERCCRGRGLGNGGGGRFPQLKGGGGRFPRIDTSVFILLFWTVRAIYFRVWRQFGLNLEK
jgi:hypothetical protein